MSCRYQKLLAGEDSDGTYYTEKQTPSSDGFVTYVSLLVGMYSANQLICMPDSLYACQIASWNVCQFVTHIIIHILIDLHVNLLVCMQSMLAYQLECMLANQLACTSACLLTCIPVCKKQIKTHYTIITVPKYPNPSTQILLSPVQGTQKYMCVLRKYEL